MSWNTWYQVHLTELKISSNTFIWYPLFFICKLLSSTWNSTGTTSKFTLCYPCQILLYWDCPCTWINHTPDNFILQWRFKSGYCLWILIGWRVFDDLTTFVFESFLYEHDKRKNITFLLNSYWYKNSRPQATNTTNGIVKTQRKIGKEYVPEHPESDQSSSDSSSSESDSPDGSKYRKSKSKIESDLSDDSKYRKYKIKRRDKKKKRRKRTKQGSSDSFLGNSDSSDQSYYKSKRYSKKKSSQKNTLSNYARN